MNKLCRLTHDQKRLLFCLFVGTGLGFLVIIVLVALDSYNFTTIYTPHEHRALNILKNIAPKDVVGVNLVRVGRNGDGGYITLNEFPADSVAYSFGIGQEISWDCGIANRGMDVYMYDHTIKALPHNNKRFRFFKTGICGKNCHDKNLKTFEQLIKENNHENKQNIILKIDTEGAEWEAFADMSFEAINRCNQIIVELHWLNRISDKKEYEKIINILQKINETHQSVHLHGTNFDTYEVIDGEPIPNVIEVTYARKKNHKFTKNYKCYPIEGLDKPCNPKKGDYFLGFVGMLAEQ